MGHGVWCHSKTIPMTCRHCGQKIYYFFCDCGCRVFFDNLGGDWPIHECSGSHFKKASSAKPIPKILKPTEKVLWSLITADEIEKEYKIRVRKNQSAFYNSKVPILFMEAKKDISVTTTDIIKEIVSPVNIFKIFNISKNSVIGAILSKQFKDQQYQQITIHTTNLADNTKDSYTAC
jgi:hypothetical protein